MSTEEVGIPIPSSPKDLKEIQSVMNEISASMTRIEAERDFQKDAFKALQEKHGIKAKYFRRMAKEHHKRSFDKTMNETESFATLYENVFSVSQQTSSPDEE